MRLSLLKLICSAQDASVLEPISLRKWPSRSLHTSPLPFQCRKHPPFLHPFLFHQFNFSRLVSVCSCICRAGASRLLTSVCSEPKSSLSFRILLLITQEIFQVASILYLRSLIPSFLGLSFAFVRESSFVFLDISGWVDTSPSVSVLFFVFVFFFWLCCP